MISLSNLIKSSYVVSIEDLRRLEWENRYAAPASEEQGDKVDVEERPDEETISIRDQIIQDAEAFAEDRMKQTADQIEQMVADTNRQIEQWWKERRIEDEQLTEAAKALGFEEGYEEGFAKGSEENDRSWQEQMTEARQMLDQAYKMREQIIQEAEPFLVELSCSIAEKIIGKQLSITPELAIELIQKSLSRRREQGMITLCVAPRQLAFVQAAREELSVVIDSQAELQILPDASVKDQGCVIRSSFGSIDARIDTQLEEIKRELVQLAVQSEERRQTDESSA